MGRCGVLAVVAAAVAASLALAGCSSGPASQSSDGTTLSLWVPQGTAAIAPYVARFNASHPDVEVTVREIPFSQYDTALGQAFSAGQGPDLAQINGTSMPSFAGRGYLQPISPIVGESGDLAPDNFYPNLYQAAAFDGEQMTLPIDTGTRVLQYNEKLFEKAGVASFGETATYPEILAAARRIRSLGPQYYGFCYVGGVKEYTLNSTMGPFVVMSGGSFVDPTGKTATLDTPEAIAGVSFFTDLAATASPADIVATSAEPCVEAFGAGAVGMQFDGFWNIPSGGAATADFELGQTLPMDETVYSTTGGWVLGVPSYVTSDKRAVLRAFVTDMYQPENLVAFTGLMPATRSGRDAAEALKAPQYNIYWKILDEHAGDPIPPSDQLVEQGNLLTSTLQSILRGEVSVEDAMAQANTALQATLTG